jgi:hypothetical protein
MKRHVSIEQLGIQSVWDLALWRMNGDRGTGQSVDLCLLKALSHLLPRVSWAEAEGGLQTGEDLLDRRGECTMIGADQSCMGGKREHRSAEGCGGHCDRPASGGLGAGYRGHAFEKSRKSSACGREEEKPILTGHRFLRDSDGGVSQSKTVQRGSHVGEENLPPLPRLAKNDPNVSGRP